MKKLIYLTTCYISILYQLYAVDNQQDKDYLWPIKSSNHLSSTFGEYREGHFHSGIDIKTNYRIGYPVYAIDDGYVWRVRTSPFGYGKAVYIKMKDGNIAVYGHLDEFSSKIRAYVISRQLKYHRYATDIFFEEGALPVRKSEVIAYSGATGTLHPHLHFEVRDSVGKPLNPLNTNLKVEDSTNPTIEELAIVPISASSRVNGSPEIQIFPVRCAGKEVFAIENTIQVTGNIGVEIKTYDTVYGIPNKYAPYGMKLYVDSLLEFSCQYDKFDFSETYLVEVDRDYQLKQENNGYFNRLWKYDTSIVVPFYDNSKTGILNLEEGNHTVRIEVYDHNRNTSILNFNLFSKQVRTPEIIQFERDLEGYKVVIKRDSTHEYENFRASWVTKYGNTIQAATVDSTVIGENSYTILISGFGPGSEILKIYAYTDDVAAQPAYIIFGSTTPANYLSVDYSYIHNPYTFLCNIVFSNIPEGEPEFFIQSEDSFERVNLIQKSPIEFITEPIPLSQWYNSIAWEIRLFNGLDTTNALATVFREKTCFECVTPSTPVEISSSDKIFNIKIGCDVVYDSLLVWIDTVRPFPVKGGEFLSKGYRISPSSQPLKKNISIAFILPMGEEKSEQIGIYRYDDKWKFEGNKIDSSRLAITAETDETGIFTLIRDFTPPTIKRIFPGNGSSFKSSDVKILEAYVKDELSELKDDTSIQVTLNGKPVIAEYNAPQNHIRYKLPQPLSPGQYILEIVAIDRALNSNSTVSRFVILEG